jgi:CDK inhibitor PHO81
LQNNKASFFLQLDRELDRVNWCYIKKEEILKQQIDILCEKKHNAYRNGDLGSKSSVTYISLHEGFLRFRRDLDRLEQFIELNSTGFSKVLKKWDKRSKLHTKEMYLSRAVEVQPVFHREELSKFSDMANSSILELEAWADGDQVLFDKTGSAPDFEPVVHHANSNRDRDDLYYEFIKTTTVAHQEESKTREAVREWVNQLSQMPDAAERITRIFLLTIASEAPDVALQTLYESGLVDLNATDEISGKNCLHRAASVGRICVVQLAIDQKVDVNSKDKYGKTALHYACIGNHREVVHALLGHEAEVNCFDNDNFSPLLYAIVNKFEDCFNDLMKAEARVDVDSEKDYIPLNLACQYGFEAAVKVLLTKNPDMICADAEGLYPIHIVARVGNFELVPLLRPYVDINQLDKLNGWPALCYAASEGHAETVKALLQAKADPNVLDEDGYSALYYACWEGHVNCIKELSKVVGRNADGLAIDNSTANSKITGISDEGPSQERNKLEQGFDEMELSDAEAIPDLSLPPPIIPLRRYGHNFLDKKVIIQVLFDASANPIKFHTNENSLSAGRLTVSTHNNADLIPQSIILPFSDTDKSMSFQVDSLEDFALDFEIFPRFGTQIIAKTSALSSVFNSKNIDNYASEHYCTLPLFDMRMKPVGEMSFRFQIVKPYHGKPLEITKYDTYWKSTSQVEKQQLKQNPVQSLSFVTASSLVGEYCRIFVCLTKDQVPVVTRHSWTVDVTKDSGVEIPIGDLTLQRLLRVIGLDEAQLEETYKRVEKVNNGKDIDDIIGNGNTTLPLEEFLRRLPVDIKLDVGVMYPTLTDASYTNIGLTSFVEVNVYVDHILTVLFNHAREVRRSGNGTHNRSLIFSSAHPDICTVLNWKQPNYPVFFHMNALAINSEGYFAHLSSHGFPAEEQDRRCVSLKEASTFASHNNLLGIICSSRLLSMVPSLIEAVRVLGLVLVCHGNEKDSQIQGVDGTRVNNVLVFKDNIDV